MCADDQVWERGLAVADGRIPEGVQPDSPAGRYYARLIDHVRATTKAAPPMTAAAKATVVTLLRGGVDD